MGGMGGMDHSMGMGASPWGDAGDVTYPHFLINGKVPTAPEAFEAQPGQRIRIRLINAASDTIFAVALNAHRMSITHTDGFAVDGLGVPGLAMWKGDKVAACVSAASIVAKVTRDRIMVAHDPTYPAYGFAIHKGYCTALHQAALDEHGPSEIHRWCFDNVARTARVMGP